MFGFNPANSNLENKIIPFNDLDADVRQVILLNTQIMLSTVQNEEIFGCMVTTGNEKYPIVVTASKIMKFTYHGGGFIPTAEIFPATNIRKISINGGGNHIRITIYHRGVIFLDVVGRRFINIASPSGTIPRMMPSDNYRREDPTDDSELIGSFDLPQEQEVFNEFTSILRKLRQIKIEESYQ
jgi:hypothetical protein